MANFVVRDGYGSVITIQSSTFGTAERQIVGASIIGTFPVTITGTPSISGTVNITGTPSISGTVLVNNGSVVAFQGGAWTPSVSGTVGASVIGLSPFRLSDGTETLDLYEENQIDTSVVGIAMMFRSNSNTSIISVVSPLTPLPIVGSVSGSVGIVGNPSISGTVNINPASVQVLNPVSVLAVTQSGAWSTSLVGTIAGSVVAFQGGAWSASVVGNVGQTGTIISSISGAIVVSQGSVLTTIAPTTAVTSVHSNIANRTLLASNTGRRGATVANVSATSIMVKLGTTATALDYTVLMQDTDYYEVPFNYSGNIDAIASSTAGIIRVTEIS